MYADAVLYLSANDSNSFSLTASSGGGVWMEGIPRRDDPKLPATVFETTKAAAAHLPEVLAALNVSNIPIAQTCIGVVADQGLRFGDVMAFRDAVSATGVRRVEFAYHVLAED